MCVCEDMGSQKPLNFTFIHTDSTFHWCYALNFRHTPAITEISRIQVHTGTSHVFCHTSTAIACVLSNCGQPKTAEFLVYTHGLDISLVLCSQLPAHSGNRRDIPEACPHRYLTRILSHKHCHRMCICQDVGSQKPLNFSFIHTEWTFHWCYALNFRHTLAIAEISRRHVHTGTSHVFCHTSTVIACVCVEQ